MVEGFPIVWRYVLCRSARALFCKINVCAVHRETHVLGKPDDCLRVGSAEEVQLVRNLSY